MKKSIKLSIAISCFALSAFVFCGMPTDSTFFLNEFNNSTPKLDSEIMPYIAKLQQKTITDNQNIINDYQQKIDEISQKHLNISNQLAISEHNVIFKHSVQEIGKQYQELIEQSFE